MIAWSRPRPPRMARSAPQNPLSHHPSERGLATRWPRSTIYSCSVTAHRCGSSASRSSCVARTWSSNGWTGTSWTGRTSSSQTWTSGGWGK
jgi:hypothetical protein